MTVLSIWRGPINPRPTMQSIIFDVAQRHGLTVAKLRGPGTRRELAHPRHEAMFLIYETGRFSFPQIGAFFGDRDHTTVLYGVKAHKRRQAERIAAE